MNKKLFEKIGAFLFLAITFFTIAAFIHWTADIREWGPWTRAIYIIGGVATIINLIDR